MKAIKFKGLEATFVELQRCAAVGERCPSNTTTVGGPLYSHHVRELAREGHIRVEMFAHNWRVVTILMGPHAGKRTAPCPISSTPYLISDSKGSRYVRT